MKELSKIWANARFEMITLLRGWFFRIFAGLILVLFVFINLMIFSEAFPVPRIFSSLSSSAPYGNMLMLNLAQISIIVFLSTEFLKRDRKFNTAEVFYIRSMTNLSYLMGKSFGVGLLFAGFNAVILIIALGFHLLYSEMPFNWQPYVLYPLIIGFPAFVYVTGLALLLMQIIRNQAVVILVLLGYVSLTLFYLYDKMFFIFDIVCLRLPLVFSDFVGFADINLILMQRGIYTSLGLFFFLITVLIFQRLRQSVRLRAVVIILSIASLLLAVLFIQNYLAHFSDREEHRIQMRKLGKEYAGRPNATPISCSLNIIHQGNRLEGRAGYQLLNNNSFSLDSVYVCINTDLKVREIRGAKSFNQYENFVDIILNHPMGTGQTDSLIIIYNGGISDDVCFLDYKNEAKYNAFNLWLYRIPGKHHFLDDNYVLLSPETYWYPRFEWPRGLGFPEVMHPIFVKHNLSVKTNSGLTVISQGKRTLDNSGVYRIQPESPLPALSLVIGPYEEKSVGSDSLRFSLYKLSGHNYYEAYFEQLGDTLESVLLELKQDYENALGMEYPFKRFSFIEVPVQYQVYPRIFTVAQETVQPEQVWVQENAASIIAADFKMQKREMDRRKERSNQTYTEIETQVSILKFFLNNVLFGKRARGFRFGGPRSDYIPDYNIFPNYYTFVTMLDSKQWPVLNTAIESYLYDRVTESGSARPSIYVEGLTEDEQVSQALLEKNLAEQLAEIDTTILLNKILQTKGSFLLKSLKNNLQKDIFDQSLKETVIDHKFSSYEMKDFFGKLKIPELDEKLQSWYYENTLPAYLIYDVRVFKIMDGDRIRNQIIFSISNMEKVDGLIEVSFRYGREGRGMGFGPPQSDDEPLLYQIAANENKTIGILLDEEPRNLTINSLIARNLPSVYSKRFDKAELNEKAVPFSGEKLIDNPPALESKGEYIVDNVDQGFHIHNAPYTSVLKRWIHQDKEETGQTYHRFRWWGPPPQWSLVKNASLYGTIIHSGYYIGPGEGEKYVSWKTHLDEDGLYDVYAYMMSKDGFWRGRGRRREATFGDYNFIVHHDADNEKVTMNADDAAEGWIFLGTWYFSEGEARVDLTDKSYGRFIVADAVKWVKN